MWGSLLKKVLTVSITFGIRVIPPTRITSSISFLLNPESFNAVLQGANVFLINDSVNDSNFALVSLRFKCFGPVLSAVINGKLISVCVVDDNSHLAFSAASLIL